MDNSTREGDGCHPFSRQILNMTIKLELYRLDVSIRLGVSVKVIIDWEIVNVCINKHTLGVRGSHGDGKLW
jgi:hypothetical protein